MPPDVVALPTAEIVKMRRKGLLERYEPPEASVYPPELRNPYFTVYCLKPYGFAYNKLKVKTEDLPRRYSELAEPKWNGLMLHIDPLNNDGALLWLAHMVDILGPSLLKKIFQQASATFRDFDEAARRIASGEHHAAFPVRMDKPPPEEAALGFTHIPPVFIETESVALITNASNPNAAKLFINFLLSEESQKTLTSQGHIPARPHTHANISLAEMDPIFDMIEFDSQIWKQKASDLYG